MEIITLMLAAMVARLTFIVICSVNKQSTDSQVIYSLGQLKMLRGKVKDSQLVTETKQLHNRR